MYTCIPQNGNFTQIIHEIHLLQITIYFDHFNVV